VKRNKTVITNDVVNDPRIKYPVWAEKEKLRSFTGYTITFAGKPIGVLEMFSRKTLHFLNLNYLEYSLIIYQMNYLLSTKPRNC
jgi:hypothetical protein